MGAGRVLHTDVPVEQKPRIDARDRHECRRCRVTGHISANTWTDVQCRPFYLEHQGTVRPAVHAHSRRRLENMRRSTVTAVGGASAASSSKAPRLCQNLTLAMCTQVENPARFSRGAATAPSFVQVSLLMFPLVAELDRPSRTCCTSWEPCRIFDKRAL